MDAGEVHDSVKRLLAFFCLLFLGLVVYFLGGYWTGPSRPVISIIRSAVPVLLFALVLIVRRVEALRRWRPALAALFAASCGFLVAWWLAGPLLGLIGVAADTVRGIAVAKLVDTVLIVLPVLLVARLSGMGRHDLFLGRGRARAWLATGLVFFVAFAAIFLMQAFGEGMSASQLAALAPWTMLFVFSNAFLEELHFRGLLLGPFGELLGPWGANACIALFFTLTHAPVTYTPDLPVFLSVLLLLALAWGFIIQKTESIWGAVLFHAGADLLIVIGIYQTYGAL